MRGVQKMGALIVTVSLFAVSLASASSVAALSPDGPPAEPPSSPLRVSAYSLELTTIREDTIPEYHEKVHYIELQNTSDKPVNLNEYILRVTDTNGLIVATAVFSDEPLWSGYYLPPGGFVTVSFNGSVSDTQFDFDAAEVNHEVSKPLLNREFQLFWGDVGVYSKAVKLKLDSLEQTRLVFMTVTAEEQAAEALKVYDTPLYKPAQEFPLAPIEVLANPKACDPREMSSDCAEYVKFYNSTNDTVEFDDTRLRIGYLGQSSSANNTSLLSGSVEPGEYAIFSLPITNSGGYVWLEDMYGVVPFENTVVEYPDASATSRRGMSWALIDGMWQWATPSPGGENIAIAVDVENDDEESNLVPCRADQYRSSETNRCRLIASVSSSLKPCAANQSRNPETNRCRDVTSSSSALTPCAANQYRNPETNRCRLIASAASTLNPCAANQERNADTNRCRAILSASVPKADFPVEESEKTNDQPLGWIVFAGVGLMALGYAGWEWRYEIAGISRKLKGLVTKA